MTDETNDSVSAEEEITFLRNWAANNKAYFEDEGSVGFGRECVGIVKGDEYPAYRHYEQVPPPEYLQLVHECAEADPPDGVEDAYHKHDCLAVLGRGPSAIHQLYVWVKHLEARDIVIGEIRRRQVDMVNLLFHGVTAAVLVKRGGELPSLPATVEQHPGGAERP